MRNEVCDGGKVISLYPCRKQDGPYIYAYLCNDNAPDFSDPPESEEKETRGKLLCALASRKDRN